MTSCDVIIKPKRIAIFGKDCYQNLVSLKRFIPEIQKEYRPKCYVGVANFRDLLESEGVSVTYIERCPDAGSYDLGISLGRLLDVDEVYLLPVRGRMSTIEEKLAMELGLKIFDIQSAYNPNGGDSDA